MTGIERLLTFYNAAPVGSTQSAIVRKMLENITEIGRLSIYELAERCYTSPASISRLVRKVGYRNYAFFQKDLVDFGVRYDIHNRWVSPEYSPPDGNASAYFLDTFRGLFDTFCEQIDLDQVRELNRVMHEAERVLILSYSVVFAEMLLQTDLFMTGRVCEVRHLEPEILESIRMLSSTDYVILIAPSAVEGIAADRIVQEVRESGAKIALITDSQRVAHRCAVERSFVLPGVNRAIDMFIIQLFLGVVDMEYRKAYLDKATTDAPA